MIAARPMTSRRFSSRINTPGREISTRGTLGFAMAEGTDAVPLALEGCYVLPEFGYQRNVDHDPYALQRPTYPCVFQTTEEGKMMRLMVPFGALIAIILLSSSATAHRSGCHRWHSCPSDRGTYVCGDLGYRNYCPRKPAATTPSAAPASRSTITATQNLLGDLGYDPGP